MGNQQIASVDMIGSYELTFVTSICGCVECHGADMARNIIYFKALYDDGFDFAFDNGLILVLKRDTLL